MGTGPAILGLSPNESVGEAHEDSGQSGSTTTTAGTKAKKHKADKKKNTGKGQPVGPGQGYNPAPPAKNEKKK